MVGLINTIDVKPHFTGFKLKTDPSITDSFFLDTNMKTRFRPWHCLIMYLLRTA